MPFRDQYQAQAAYARKIVHHIGGQNHSKSFSGSNMSLTALRDDLLAVAGNCPVLPG
jgi:hypothetical protein